MTPDIKCDQFTVTISGEREVMVVLEVEGDDYHWMVSYDSESPAGNIFQKFADLDKAVPHARKLAGNKVV